MMPQGAILFSYLEIEAIGTNCGSRMGGVHSLANHSVRSNELTVLMYCTEILLNPQHEFRPLTSQPNAEQKITRNLAITIFSRLDGPFMINARIRELCLVMKFA